MVGRPSSFWVAERAPEGTALSGDEFGEATTEEWPSRPDDDGGANSKVISGVPSGVRRP
jgi:hypothetical protein